MVKIKNKFTKKALAFASAFIILCFVLIVPCLAQAPEYDFDFVQSSSGVGYTNGFIYFCDVGTNDVIMIYNQVYDMYDNYSPVTSPNIIFTELYYNNFYIYGSDSYNPLDSLFQHKFDCYGYLIKNTIFGDLQDGFYRFNNVDVYTCIQQYSTQFLYGNLPLSSTDLYNSMSSAENYQFYYWESQFQVQFDNGFAEGQQAGLQTGYNNGYDDGLSDGYDDGYNNGYELGRLNGYNDGLSEGESLGYDSGYRVGRSEGYNSGLTEGYTNAINDYDYFARGIFTIFSAPFEFVRQLTFFDVFGIAIFPIFAFIILILLGFLIIKFVKGGIF